MLSVIVALLPPAVLRALDTMPPEHADQRTYPLSGRVRGLCGEWFIGTSLNNKAARWFYICRGSLYATKRGLEPCEDSRLQAAPLEGTV